MVPKTRLILFFLLLILSFSSCSNPTDPSMLPSVTLTVDGVTATEATIKLSTSNISLPASVTLSRNSKQINSFTLITADTTIVDNNLNPNQSYSYQATIQSSNQTDIRSEAVTVTTMDTTSHNFTWQSFTFGGQGGSSILWDVAIINENNIWAVGEMYVYDSTGTPTLFNAVHWDGGKWELKRIPFEYKGQNLFGPIYSIFTFNKDDIWFGIGNMIHWNGVKYLPEEIPPSVFGPHLINKIWGISSNEFYVVGNNGSIALYKNGFWTKLESGTNLNINDIWGDFNTKTGKYEILAVASEFKSLDRAILSIDPFTIKVTQLSTQPIGGRLNSVWFKNNKKYFVTGGAGNFEKHKLSETNWKNSFVSILRYSILRTRGNGLNDVFGAGGGGEVLHFNGKTTKSYYNTTKLSNGNYYSVAVKSNLVVAVGEDNPKAVLIIGKR